MSRRGQLGVSALALALWSSVPACGGGSASAPPANMAFVVPSGVPGGPPPSIQPPPLPAGWAWPFNPVAVARGLPANTVYRPVNVAALQAARARAPNACGPFEVAPSVWVTPLCGRLGIGRLLRARALQLQPPVVQGPGAPPGPVFGAAPGAHTIRSASELPQSVDLRTLGLEGPVRDQQSAPVCWSFAFSSVMENAVRRAGRNDVVAPLHLISNDEWRVIQRSGVGNGTTLEPSWPYDPHKACKLDAFTANSNSCEDAYGIKRGTWREDPELVAEQQRMDALSALKIAAIQPLQDSPGNPDEIASVLTTGLAVYAELEINMRAWSVWSQGPGAVIPDWQPDGVGGHAVIVSGYYTANGRRSFLIHNSWGTSWGDGGYAWISEAMMRERLNDAWTITLADAQGRVIGPNRSPVPVPPVPVPVPVPPPSTRTTGRTSCPLTGLFGDGTRVTPRAVPVDEQICTNSSGGGESPGQWLHYCRKVSSGDMNCGATSRVDTPVCLAAVIGGRSRAACCPADAKSPLDPRCVTPDKQHPPGPND